MNETIIKKCTDCGKEYPATTEFFHKKGDRLQSKCKSCRKKDKLEYLKHNKENKMVDMRVLMSEKSRDIFDMKASEFNMSRADFFRLLVLRAETTPLIKINPECFDTFNYQIMGIARNINQIAYLCNKVVNVHKADIKQLQEEVKKIREWQAKLEKEFKSIHESIKYAGEIITFDDI